VFENVPQPCEHALSCHSLWQSYIDGADKESEPMSDQNDPNQQPPEGQNPWV